MIKCYWCFIATSVHFCWKLHWIVYFEFWRNAEASFSIETMLILGMWSEVKWRDVTWCDIQPSMVTHTQISCSAFTHPSAHTHREHTHGAVGSHLCGGAAGSSWGFGALLKGTSVVVLKVGRALYIHSPHLQSLPDRDSNSQPFDYDSNSLPLGYDFPLC